MYPKSIASYVPKTWSENNGTATPYTERLANAKCGSKFVRRNITCEENATRLNVHSSLTKNSHISFKRAAASNPCLHSAMIRMFKEELRRKIDDGIFDEDGPLDCNVIDLDEIGFDPDGLMYKTYSLGNKRNRLFKLRSTEHAPFHATLLYGVVGDGALTSPILIHQGKDTSGDMALNLGDEFYLDNSPSGYADTDTFKIAVRSMTLDHQAKWVYLDGHYSHFDAESIKYALDHDLCMNYLKANDSIGDAAIDNGPNSKLKGIYAQEYTKWRIRNPREPMRRSIFNLIITAAWRKFTQDTNLKSCIVKAYKKTSTWPLVDCFGEDGKINPDYSAARFKANAALSLPFITDERDRNRILYALNTSRDEGDKAKDDDDDEDDISPAEVIVENNVVSDDSVRSSRNSSSNNMVSIQYANAEPGSKHYRVLMKAASKQFFEKSYLEYCKEQQRLRQEDTALRRVKIPRQAPNVLQEGSKEDEDYYEELYRGIPNTTTGHCATAQTVRRIEHAQAKKIEVDKGKEQRYQVFRRQCYFTRYHNEVSST